MSENKNVKKRNWTAVLYPESLPENWKDILQQTGLQCAISPLHDKDINATGEPKKPHYHVILCYQGPTSYNVVQKLTKDTLNGTIPQPLEQVRGMYRYFCHIDNPEKAQYSEADIQFIGGFNIRDFVELTKSEVSEIKNRLVKLIRDERIYEYCDLIERLQDENKIEELEVATGHTIFFNSFITSRRKKREKGRYVEVIGRIQTQDQEL